MNTSDQETLKHIRRVQSLLGAAISKLIDRAVVHDQSKLADPESSVFAEYTEKLKNSTYGSEEYKQFLAEMKPAIDHHYASNSHHPEHFKDGICGMSLLDLVEMIVDWKAASERHDNGDILRSIDINQKRFGYSDELKGIFVNTARELFGVF